MSHDTVRYEKIEQVGILRLNRPERMNAVIEEMYVDLQEILSAAKDDPEVRALVLTGSVREKDGIKKQAFCAGADLKKHDKGDRTHGDKRRYLLLAHETCRLLHVFPKPVIAAVNGAARGAGVEMALCADLIMMADEASMAFTETGLGTFVGGGATQHLPKLVGPARAKELVYTGRVVDGPTAVEIGMAISSHPIEQLESEALALAKKIAGRAPVSLFHAKTRLQQPATLDLETVLHLEAEAILSCMDTEDWHEGIRSFAEKRNPVFTGK